MWSSCAMAISFSNNLQKCTHYFVDVDVYKPQKLRKNWFIYLTNSTKQWRSTQHKSLTNSIKALYIRSSKTPNSYKRKFRDCDIRKKRQHAIVFRIINLDLWCCLALPCQKLIQRNKTINYLPHSRKFGREMLNMAIVTLYLTELNSTELNIRNLSVSFRLSYRLQNKHFYIRRCVAKLLKIGNSVVKVRKNVQKNGK